MTSFRAVLSYQSVNKATSEIYTFAFALTSVDWSIDLGCILCALED